MTTRRTESDPPTPDEIELNGLRIKVGGYTEFADRMIRAVYGKSRYGASSTSMLFDDLVSPSQEAFTLLLYRNGYDNWMWMHNHASLSSGGSEDSNGPYEGGGEGDEDGCPKYKYTKRTGDFTSRNGGWSREGMKKYNELYNLVQKDRKTDAGTFGGVYKVHRDQLSGKKRKRRNNDGGQREKLTISDDLGQLLTAMDSSDGSSSSGAVEAV